MILGVNYRVLIFEVSSHLYFPNLGIDSYMIYTQLTIYQHKLISDLGMFYPLLLINMTEFCHELDCIICRLLVSEKKIETNFHFIINRWIDIMKECYLSVASSSVVEN